MTTIKSEAYEKTENLAKNGLTENLREDTQEIKKDLKSLKGNIVGLANKAIESGSEGMEGVRHRAGAELEKLRAAGMEGMKKAEERVRAKPGQSIAVAFLAGFLVNALFGRK